MNKTLVWDIPTRLCHWGLAFFVSAAMGIGFLADDDSPLFRLHMLSGLAALFLAGVRVLLGFAGSRHARFASFPLRPRETVVYFVSALSGKTKRHPGNNPGSALAAILMIGLVVFLAATGTDWTGATREDAHETAAWVLLCVVGLHLLGLAWHTIRHRENIALSIVTGRKPVEESAGIPSANLIPGLVLLVICGGWITALFLNQPPGGAGIRLPVFGFETHPGESGWYSEGNTGKEPRKRHSDDDHDDEWR